MAVKKTYLEPQQNVMMSQFKDFIWQLQSSLYLQSAHREPSKPHSGVSGGAS